MRTSTFSGKRRCTVLVFAGLLACTSTGWSQSASDQEKQKQPDGVEDMKNQGLAELNLFGGGSFFKEVNQGLGHILVPGGIFGVRVTANPWKYIGLEFGYGYSTNNVRFQNPAVAGQPAYAFGARTNQFNLNPIFHLTPRGSRLRPFLTIGVSSVRFAPTTHAIQDVTFPRDAAFQVRDLKSDLLPALNYGGGIKYHLTDWLGLRFDARGLFSTNPTYGILGANPGGVYIPRGSDRHGLQTTAGLDFYFGKKSAPPSPPPPPPPAAPKPQPLPNLIAGVIRGCDGDMYPNQPVKLHLDEASDPAGKTVTYQWKVNGARVGAGTTYSLTPANPGPVTAEVEEEAPDNEGYPNRMAKAGPATCTILDFGSPTVTLTPQVQSAAQGEPIRIATQATPGAGATSVRTTLTASEGAITGGGNDWSLDTSTVRFELNGKPQSKPVILTATATNDAGKSATAQKTVTVTYASKAIRFSDIVFQKDLARVNNCGKRILIDELAAKAVDADYDVVLVGHIDADEAPKAKLPKGVKSLDEKRVLNAAAVLTAGKGTCASVDPARVKIVAAGSSQISDMQPGLCGTSARPASKERSTVTLTEKDQNRRVEVWLVPRAGQSPPAAAGAMPVTGKELKPLACPN